MIVLDQFTLLVAIVFLNGFIATKPYPLDEAIERFAFVCSRVDRRPEFLIGPTWYYASAGFSSLPAEHPPPSSRSHFLAVASHFLPP
jgi:hypothetical protein